MTSDYMTQVLADLDRARQVQIRLLPHTPPPANGLVIAASSRPALLLGGDFHEFIRLPGQPLLVSVGDIAGKGVAAALLMTMTRLALNSKVRFMPNPTPATVLRQANEDLYHDFAEVGLFATAFVGQYLPERRVLRYANAGHSPVIYRPAGGRASLLRADSTAIGVLPTLRAANYELALGVGDLLIIATDGLADASNSDDERFGHSRLLALADQLAGQPAQAIGDELLHAIDRFAGPLPQSDDITVVVMQGQ